MERNNDIQIDVMMFGGRRCGKTSVLAAMQNCFEEKFGRSNLTIYPVDGDTIFAIEEKTRELNGYFFQGMHNRRFVPDDNPTLDVAEYKFYISLKNKPNGKIIINFIDYPGEWLDDKSKCEKLQSYMKKSRIIIVAIDSPYLMEELPEKEESAVGVYNDKRNYSLRISNMLKGLELTDTRMILFVPLKCEKYYHANKMTELRERIKSAYKEVFNYIKGNEKYFQIAITPILTMGGAEFSRFKRNDNGEIELNEINGLPSLAEFCFPDSERKFEPKYCEQPILHILLYVLEMAKREKDEVAKTKFGISLWLSKLMESFLRMPSAVDFMNEQKAIKTILKEYDDGYEIYQNTLKF